MRAARDVFMSWSRSRVSRCLSRGRWVIARAVSQAYWRGPFLILLKKRVTGCSSSFVIAVSRTEQKGGILKGRFEDATSIIDSIIDLRPIVFLSSLFIDLKGTRTHTPGHLLIVLYRKSLPQSLRFIFSLRHWLTMSTAASGSSV